MKRIAFALLLTAAVASPAVAGQVRVNGYGPYQTLQGGEFTLNIVSGPEFDTSGYLAGSTKNVLGGNSFQTFCIESSSPPEYIRTNTDYDARLNQNAVFGGTGQLPGDAVSQGTGWLYSQFARGTLDGYIYNNSGGARAGSAGDSADLLQKAIWWLEGEGGVSFTSSNIFMAAVKANFGNSEYQAKFSDSTIGGWTYGVYAINLTRIPDGEMGQDQLFYRVPDGGATLVLLGGALLGLGALRRKFSA